MAKEIVNRVKNSGIMTIDFDYLLVPNIFELDLKNWLVDYFFLVEKKFREVAHELAPDHLNIDRLILNRLFHQTPDLPDKNNLK